MEEAKSEPKAVEAKGNAVKETAPMAAKAESVRVSRAETDSEKSKTYVFFKKHMPFLFDAHSLFYFVLALLVLSMLWMGYSLYTNYFTQLYGWDYEIQYVSFYYSYWDSWHEFFRTGHFILYDNTTYLGTDNIGSNSYYGLFDPFVAIMVLFPRSSMPQMTAVVTWFKLMAAALFMRSYLKYMGISEWTARLGAVALAFSGYVNFFVGFPSFVSAVTYMPLFLWGIEKTMRERKPYLLCLAIFLEEITNFMLLVPMCIWGVLYALWRYFQTIKTRNWKGNVGVIFLGVGAFAVGLMLGAWSFLPSFRETSLSGRASSIGTAYLHSLRDSLKTMNLAEFFRLLFTQVGENPGRELMALVSFFYPTGSYLYLPLMYPSFGSQGGTPYDAWTSSIFVYTLFAILFFLAIMNSIRKKKWSHLVAVAFVCYLLFTTFAYYGFFAFSGNGYGRWYFVLIPEIIYYGCWAFDDRKEQPSWFTSVASLLALGMTVFTYFLTILVLKGKTFNNPNNLTYFPIYYATAFEDVIHGSTINASYKWTETLDPRGWYIPYQICMVLLNGAFLVLSTYAGRSKKRSFRKYAKKLSYYPLFAIMAIEVIIMGNASFFYGMSYSLDYYQGGPDLLNAATEASQKIKKQDDDFYRCYFDSVNDPQCFQNAAGYNGTSSFHSLMNFNVTPLALMIHMTHTGSWGESYGEKHYNPSWSGSYVNKRFATDAALGMRYYAIRKDGYGEFQGHNAPWGSKLIYENGQYEVYQRPSDSIPTLGHAVDKSKIYRIGAATEYPQSHYANSFFQNSGGLQGAFEVMRNEDVMIDGAIVDDDFTLPEGFTAIQGAPSYSSNRYVNRRLGTSKYKISLYNTDAEKGDLFLDYDLATGADGKTYYVHGEHWDQGPAYFLQNGTYSGSVQPETGTIKVPRDTGHLTFLPEYGDYFNEDPTGAYFTLRYSTSSPMRCFFIGDTFNEDGTVKATYQLLSFEYHALEDLPNGYSYSSAYFGFYPEGRVRAIVFEPNGPANGYASWDSNAFSLFMQERHEAYSTANPGDSIESMSKYLGSDYALKNVKTINHDTFSFDTDFAEEELVVTQIAYDQGWQVSADGQKLTTCRLDGGFVGFFAPAGKHHYVMKYETPNLKKGVALAVAGVVLLGGYFLGSFLVGRKKEKEAAASKGK